MFRRKTLFVVGAGASVEAGLPDGRDLATQIAAVLNCDPSGEPSHPGAQLLAQVYNAFPIGDNGYTRAAVRIAKGVSFAKSIDDFLDRHSNNEPIQRVGKAAIAKCILAAESGSAFCKYNFGTPQMARALKDSWYIRFFRALGSDVKLENVREISDNVSFIVFNYDRCIEHFLENALQLLYGIPASDARSIIDDMNIIHPYGTIAPLHGGRGSVPFGSTSANHAALTDNIKIYTEQNADGDMLSDIADLMYRAEQIAFLGFGFHEQNLLLLTPSKPLPSKPVFGTAKGWSLSDRDEVQARIERMFLPPPPRVNQKSAVILDNQASCAQLFDHYGQSLTGR